MFLAQAHEVCQVAVARKVIFPRLLLVDIPEHVGTYRIHTHSLAHLDTVLPVLVRYAQVVYLSGLDDKGFAIEQEVVLAYFEGMHLRCSCRLARHGHT